MKKLFMPQVLKRIKTVGTMNPRHSVLKKCKEVYCFKGSDSDLWEQIETAKEDLFRGFNSFDRILIKINLNTADPYPASTHPSMIDRLLNLMDKMGFKSIMIGDCSSLSALPTKRVFKKTSLPAVVKDRAKVVFFDEGEWVSVPVGGELLKNIVIPKIVFEVERIIYVSNLKTHRLADFSMNLKLAVGFVHPRQRYDFHDQYLQEKVAETALAIEPDLVFLDAREPFITLGPEKGRTARGDCIFTGRDLLSVDLEGYRLLYELQRQENCLDNFMEDPFEMRQFKHARKILG